MKSARVTGLLEHGSRVAGVRYSATSAAAAAGDERTQPADAVVLATGGFGANRDLLRRHAPAVAELATTNGPWAQGEGLALAAGAGATMVGLDQVQVRPPCAG